MPKKKSPQKPGKPAGQELVAEVVEAAEEDMKEMVLSEREAHLQTEHKALSLEQEGLRKRIDQLRQENDFLQNEAERIRVESQEYLSYMNKKSQRREDTIISLSDQNRRELENISRQRKELESHFQVEEEKLREILLQREAELAKLQNELEKLEPMKPLKKVQQERIRELEVEVMATHARHAETVLRLKSAFLRDKARWQQDSEQQLESLTREAQEEARKALHEASTQAREENQQLRQELLHLIQRSRILQTEEKRLLRQNQQLVRERECQKEVGSTHCKIEMISSTPAKRHQN